MAEKKLQPIIVKRVVKASHAAHGGAWKIAYADFVTAMMAFFLLMWLLGSTARGDLQGIAAYFSSPLKVAFTGGDGSGNSSSIIPGGGNDLSKIYGQVRRSDSSDSEKNNDQKIKEAMKAEAQRREAQRMADLRAKIETLVDQSPKLREFRSQIRLSVTPDGLQIQIVDDKNRPMFDTGSAVVKPYMRDILREIGATLAGVENRISLAGHTDSATYGNGQRGYSNWELSADRANASRRELVAGGMPEDKLARVVGLAASDPMDPADSLAPVNRRITITVMTKEAENRLISPDRPTPPEPPPADAAAGKTEPPPAAAPPAAAKP